MSRSNYSDDIDQWDLIKWRGQVASAIRGKRGQLLLCELLEAMDAMPEKLLIAGELVNEEGDHCALGLVGAKRGLPIDAIDPEDTIAVGEAFNIAHQLAAEIVYINDEWGCYDETPQQRWQRVRGWVVSHIQPIPVEA